MSVQKIKVGIIEDNLIIRSNVVKYLGFGDDYEVTTKVGSIESFFHEFEVNQSFDIDVLLLDIGLPGMSGLDAIPKIRACDSSIDIIMLTTYEEEDKILKALCSGATSYLSKKSSLEEIANALKIEHDGGSYMSPSIAREIVTYFVSGRKSKASILTERQREILELLSQGKSYSMIAKSLFVSVETVRSHVKKMYKTLHVNNKTEAISLYIKGQIG